MGKIGCNSLNMNELRRCRYDGDTASSNGVLSKQANQEVTEHLNSTTRYIGTNGRLMHGTTDLVKLTVFNLSRDPDMK